MQDLTPAISWLDPDNSFNPYKWVFLNLKNTDSNSIYLMEFSLKHKNEWEEAHTAPAILY